jgi:hypothetical protein
LAAVLQTGTFGDRVVAEELLRLVGATEQVLALHEVDQMGRCRACGRHWARRSASCLVHDAFCHHLTGRRRLSR